MAKDETMIALMAGYLSKDAAVEDFEAVKACGADLVGQAVIAKDLEGNVTVAVQDTAVKTLTKRLGGVGFIVGLFAPPLLIATAVGAAVGAGAGEVVHKKIEAGIKESAAEAIPIGGAGLLVVYHPASSSAVEAAVTRAVKRGSGTATGPHKKALEGAMAAAQADLHRQAS